MTRSKFTIDGTYTDRIVISDVGTDSMSVTNDAENVVMELHRTGVLGSRRLFYYDSEGEFGELKHDGQGNFTGFGPA